MTLSCLDGAIGKHEQTAAWHHCPDFFKFQAIGAPLACSALLLAAAIILRISWILKNSTWRGFGCGPSEGVVMMQPLKLAGLAVLLSVAAGQAAAQEKVKIGV